MPRRESREGRERVPGREATVSNRRLRRASLREDSWAKTWRSEAAAVLVSGGRAFLTHRRADAKASRWTCSWHVRETAERQRGQEGEERETGQQDEPHRGGLCGPSDSALDAKPPQGSTCLIIDKSNKEPEEARAATESFNKLLEQPWRGRMWLAPARGGRQEAVRFCWGKPDTQGEKDGLKIDAQAFGPTSPRTEKSVYAVQQRATHWERRGFRWISRVCVRCLKGYGCR